MTGYADRWITCTDEALVVRGYYIPWGSKRIPYASIRSVRRVNMGALNGRARVWGTSNPRHWAHLDPGRLRKREGLILDLGGTVQPLLTPDDPEAVLGCIRAHAGDVVEPGRRRAPII